MEKKREVVFEDESIEKTIKRKDETNEETYAQRCLVQPFD